MSTPLVGFLVLGLFIVVVPWVIWVWRLHRRTTEIYRTEGTHHEARRVTEEFRGDASARVMVSHLCGIDIVGELHQGFPHDPSIIKR